jgi:2-amino-4-hydroxy-6-hydroxymethyldihydropteridine diphosphokinase
MIKPNGMKTMAIGIGTNQGDRIRLVSIVLEKMLQVGINILKVSSLYESQAVGYESNNLYINAVVKVESALDPETVLQKLMLIENEMGRLRSDEGYIDRPMDLDILAVEEEVFFTEILQVPHPRMETRAFVLIPFAEVWPNWKHPSTGESIEILADLVQNQALRKL